MKQEDILPGNYYHIFNRANGDSLLFYRDENYEYFLRKLVQYLSDYLVIFSYCLLPNHFLLLVFVKENIKEINLSKVFSNFFNSYAKSINKQELRNGSLFQRPFKMKVISNHDYIKIVVNYIHRNPIHHGICENVPEYEWSSYKSIKNRDSSFVDVNSVLEWFAGIDDFDHFTNKLLKIIKN